MHTYFITKGYGCKYYIYYISDFFRAYSEAAQLSMHIARLSKICSKSVTNSSLVEYVLKLYVETLFIVYNAHIRTEYSSPIIIF